MEDELLYTQEDIDEWMRTCEELQEKVREQEDEICKYQTKLENGTLVEFPCKVGETCYIIMGDKKIKEAVVINFSIEAGGIYARVRFKEGIFLYTSIAELNKTREQAEARLKELKL